MKTYYPTPRNENRDQFDALTSLKNDKGWPAVRGNSKAVMTLVSSYSRQAGCFANCKTMADKMGVSKKTVERSIKYLVETKFLRVGLTGGKKAYFLGGGTSLSPTMSRMVNPKKGKKEVETTHQAPPRPSLPATLVPTQKDEPSPSAQAIQQPSCVPTVEDWAEPLLPEERKRSKRPDKVARQMDAINKIGNGHIANPLGVTDNRPRRLCPKLARDVPVDQVSSVPQLYKFLVKSYAEVFGEAAIEDMMPQDKGAIASQFSMLAQKFIDHCNYEPRKSDLAEYFKWFLEPQRVQAIIRAADKFKGKKEDHVTWNQMTGALYVKRFYDDVISKRLDVVPSSSVPKVESASSRVKKMYDRLSMSEPSPSGFMISMVPVGYVISSQYLHDERGMGKDEIKKALFGLMRRFVSGSPDKAAAVACLRKMERFTKNNMGACDTRCVWYDWEPLAALVNEVEREEIQDGREEGVPADGSGQGLVVPDQGEVQPDIRRDLGGEEGNLGPGQDH
jgi:hypothetical protein